MGIVAAGIDLAKNVFAVHGVDETGKAGLLKPKVKRADLLAMFAQVPPLAWKRAVVVTTGRGS